MNSTALPLLYFLSIFIRIGNLLLDEWLASNEEIFNLASQFPKNILRLGNIFSKFSCGVTDQSWDRAKCFGNSECSINYKVRLF
jgi:hypothetical protein